MSNGVGVNDMEGREGTAVSMWNRLKVYTPFFLMTVSWYLQWKHRGRDSTSHLTALYSTSRTLHLVIPHHTSPHHTSLHLTSSYLTTPHFTTPQAHLIIPHHTTPHLTHHTSPHHTTLYSTTPHYTVLHHTSPHHTTPHYIVLHLTTPHLITSHHTSLHQIFIPSECLTTSLLTVSMATRCLSLVAR